MKIKKRILISILLILIILSTNIAVTLAATKSELQNKQNNINQVLLVLKLMMNWKKFVM